MDERFREAIHSAGGVNFLLIICQIVGLKLANATLWYVIELLIFYLLSYLLVRRFRLSFVQYAIVCWILFISFFGCSVVFDFGTWWFMSTCSLVLGTTYPVIARSLRRIHSSKPCMVLAVAIFTVLYVFSYHFDVLPERLGHFPKNWIITGVYMLMIPIFTMFVVYYFPEAKSSFVKWLASISYEVYLYHAGICCC